VATLPPLPTTPPEAALPPLPTTPPVAVMPPVPTVPPLEETPPVPWLPPVAESPPDPVLPPLAAPGPPPESLEHPDPMARSRISVEYPQNNVMMRAVGGRVPMQEAVGTSHALSSKTPLRTTFVGQES